MSAHMISLSFGFRGLALRRRPQTAPNVVRYAIVALVCLVCDLLLPGKAGLALSAASFLVWSLWLLKREKSAALLGLNPIVCYQAWQVATLAVAPLYIALSTEPGAGVPFGNYTLSLETVAYGHAMMVVGSWAFYAGMKRFQPREVRGDAAERGGAQNSGLLIAAAIGVAFHWGREAITSYTGSTVVQLGLLPLAVLCMVALDPPRALRRSGEVQFVVLLLGSVGVLLLNARRDSKMDLMFSFLPVVWWAVSRNKRTATAIIGLGLAALYLVVIAPLVTLMRTNVARYESGTVHVLTPDVTGRATDTMKGAFLVDPETYIETWLDKTMYRMCDPCAAAMVARLAHKDGFLWGQGLDYVPITFIPRALWHDKPPLDRGLNFTAALGWAADPSSATTSTGLTSAGELYWNFGWLGVVVGMYLLGAVISGCWWGAAGPDPRQGLLEMTAFTGVMLSFMMGSGSAAGGAFVGAISAGLFWRAAIAIREAGVLRKVNKSTVAKLCLRPIYRCE
jgi:hypothetical protein